MCIRLDGWMKDHAPRILAGTMSDTGGRNRPGTKTNMLYAILCYNDEKAFGSFPRSGRTQVMEKLDVSV